MNTINFDTLKAAKSLQDAGFETRQAEAVVGMVTYALSEGLATKSAGATQSPRGRPFKPDCLRR